MNNIVIASVPYSPLERPPLELAAIKGVLEANNLSCLTIDISAEISKHVGLNPTMYNSLMKVCAGDSDAPVSLEMLEDILGVYAHTIMSEPVDWIGLYVDNCKSHYAVMLVSAEIRALDPTQKIVLFGPGLMEKPTHPFLKRIVFLPDVDETIGQSYKRLNVVDEFIVGDAEEALVRLLQGQIIPSDFQLSKYDSDDWPFANYDDLQLDVYRGQVAGKPLQLPMQSSRGCIRKCDFCFLVDMQKKYRYRTGKSIAAEMIHLAEKYKRYEFNFLDIVTNANVKELTVWTKLIAEYNETHEQKITWVTGGWICRTPQALNPPEFYDQLAASGCKSVTIGAESASNHVLAAMDKGTTVEALYYEMEQLDRVGINFVLSLVHGHWSERWEDFLATAKFLIAVAPYARTGRLGSITTNTFSVKSNSPAGRDYEKNKIEKYNKDYWWTPLNPTLTLRERFYRTLLIRKLRDKLQLHETFYDIALHDYNKVATDLIPGLDWYNDILENKAERGQQAEHYYRHFDEFVELLLKDSPAETELEMVLEVGKVEGTNPTLDISANYRVLDTVQLNAGEVKLRYLFPSDRVRINNKIQITFSGKGHKGTIVEESGYVIKDTFAKLKSLKVDNVNLLQDDELFYNLRYTVNREIVDPVPGFWQDTATLQIEFRSPFNYWYAISSRANTEFQVINITDHTPAHREKIDDAALEEKLVKLLEWFRY